MIVAEHAARNLGEVSQLNAAKRALMRGASNVEAYNKFKWYADENGIMKRPLSNNGVTIAPPKRGEVKRLNQVINHPAFFRAIPDAGSWTASVRPLGGGVQGMAQPWRRHITLSPRAAKDRSTWLHEATHAGQAAQRLPRNDRGTNPRAAGSFAAYQGQLGEHGARVSGAAISPAQKAQIMMKRVRGKPRVRFKPPPAAAPNKKRPLPPQQQRPSKNLPRPGQ